MLEVRQPTCLHLFTCPCVTQLKYYTLSRQALDGFFLVIMTDGSIIYVSESVTSLLEHLPVSNDSHLF